MECQLVIFNAARDGKLGRLKVFLEEKPPDVVSAAVSALTYNTPPLVIAARNGHYDVVQYLLDKGADIAQTGTVTFDGEPVEAAPAIWAAAAAGHFEIVKLLISRGADVNQTTATSSSALRGACYDGHIEIVKYLVSHGADIELANRNEHTPLMIASYRNKYDVVQFLLQHNASTNRRNLLGNTCLHDAADSGSVAITKLLLQKGALVHKDKYGLTPMITAALLGHAKLVDFYITHESTSRDESVDALKLLGATSMDKYRDATAAISFWRAAITLSDAVKRTCRSELDDLNFVVDPVYQTSAEVSTLEELSELETDPEAIRMQALLIRERIVGGRHPDTFYYLRYRGAIYADIGMYDRCCALWMHALKLQQKALKPLNTQAQASLVGFVELFSLIINEFMTATSAHHGHFWSDKPAFGARIVEALDAAVFELDRHTNGDAKEYDDDDDVYHTECECRDSGESIRRLLAVSLTLVALLRALYSNSTNQQVIEARQAAEKHVHSVLYRLVHMHLRASKGETILHIACSEKSNWSSIRGVSGNPPPQQQSDAKIPCVSVLDTLFQVGASADDVDNNGNTCLMTLLANVDVHPSLVACLIKHGVHVDRCNRDGKSAIQLLELHQKPEMRSLGVQWAQSDRTLACLAARKLCQTNMPFRDVIPQHLVPFVHWHGK